jgi:23S rRNA pseudouridine2605 synthase
MKERLQKLLSGAGLCSRREAEKWILAGRVTVNGSPAGLGDGADPDTDTVCVDGKPVGRRTPSVTVLLNKPAGYVTTMHDEQGRRTVAELVRDVGVRVYPVGRLDLNSCGALLMTSDGETARVMTHPSHEVDKVYHVTVRGDLERGLPILRESAVLDGVRTRPAGVRVLRENPYGTVLEITIHEGRNRQIRRLCEAAELTVTRLCRVAVGEIRLGDLAPGKWRRLTPQELSYLEGVKERGAGGAE